ncbi:MAG: glycosyltransferase family 2 protein [Deltaproteobacteria bacterium]|nr:glycosyltransferase family 2 protein [Deltaproteobacteria bacterium]
MAHEPLVTIAMPAFNEERYIEACIASVQAQDYPADRIEILIADGRSTDRTREILADLAKIDPRIKVVDNPERLQAPGLNRLVREARGDIIVRMDVHCEYAPTYVRACVETLERTGADNVGGAQRARARTAFQKALCAALDSPAGVGGARYRSADAEGPADTVFLGAFRRRVFEKVGLWDPNAITNEDAELNQRLIDSGGQVYLSKDIEVHYYPRDSFKKLAQQYFKYGSGRARTLLKHGRFLNLRPMIPFFTVVGGAALLALPPLWPVAPLAFASYALVTGAEAVRVGRKAGATAIPTVWAIFPVLHAAHGIGFAAGLWRYLRNPDWTDPERLPPAPATRLRVV